MTRAQSRWRLVSVRFLRGTVNSRLPDRLSKEFSDVLWFAVSEVFDLMTATGSIGYDLSIFRILIEHPGKLISHLNRKFIF